jgi:hypothetical protein
MSAKGNNPSPASLEMRRREATERQEAYDKLSLQEKLDRLDRKFPGGAKKQRARLLKALEKPSAASKVEEPGPTSKDAPGSTRGKKNSGYEKRPGEERGKSGQK